MFSMTIDNWLTPFTKNEVFRYLIKYFIYTILINKIFNILNDFCLILTVSLVFWNNQLKI